MAEAATKQVSEFSVSKTPTLHLVTEGDAQGTIVKALRAALAEAEAVPEVKELIGAREKAEATVGRLQRAHRVLNDLRHDLTKKLESTGAEYLDALIDAAGEGKRPDGKKLAEVAQIRAEREIAQQAIREIVEHRLQVASINALQAEAAEKLGLSEALELIANRRAVKLSESMAAVLADEGELPVEVKRGATGQIAGLAGDYAKKAGELKQQADERQRHYDDFLKAERKIK